MSRFTAAKSWILIVAAALLAWSSGGVNAQATISADRPGMDFSPLVVGQGLVQAEFGLFGANRSGSGEPRTWSLSGQVLARAGISPDVELRVGGAPFSAVWRTSGGTTMSSTGVSDVELGLKWAARSDAGFLIAVIPSLFLPVGSDAFTADHVVLTTNVTGATALSDAVALSINAGGSLLTGDETVASGSLAVVLGRALNSRLGGFVEAGWFASEGSSSALLAGTGLTFLLTPVTQLDLFVDRGLNATADDWWLGLGLARRF